MESYFTVGNLVNYDLLKKYNTNIEKLEFKQTSFRTVKLFKETTNTNSFIIENYDSFINDIELVIELDDPDHLVNQNFIKNLINRYILIINGCAVEHLYNNNLELLYHIYSKYPKFYYNKKNSKCLINIPLLHDLTTDQNLYMSTPYSKIDLVVDFNPISTYNKDYNKKYLDIKATLKYKTGSFNNNFDFHQEIKTVFNQIQSFNYTMEINDNKFITPDIPINYLTHCIIFTFDNIELSKKINYIRLHCNGNKRDYLLKELRKDNWKYIGLEPLENHYIITFCGHTLNNYKKEDCNAINLSDISNQKIEVFFDKVEEKSKIKLNIFAINKNIAWYHNNVISVIFSS